MSLPVLLRCRARFVVPLVMCGLIGCSSAADTAPTTTDAVNAAATTDGAATTVAVSADPSEVAAVVDFAVSKGAEEGFTFDRDCVEQIVLQLGVEDVEALYVPTLDSVPGAIYPSLSADGAAITEQMTTCLISQGGDAGLIDQVVATLLASGDGPNLDSDCVHDQVSTLNDEQLHAVLDAEAGSKDPNLAKALGAVYICLVQLSS